MPARVTSSRPLSCRPESEDSLRIQMDELQEELDRAKELYLRKLADFDNYRKRQEREMAEYRRLANANLVRDLLQVVDNLERAVATPSAADESLRIGRGAGPPAVQGGPGPSRASPRSTRKGSPSTLRCTRPSSGWTVPR